MTSQGRTWLKVVADKLLLVDVRITTGALARRTCGEVLEAEAWAELEHLAASDNDDVERKPMPEWLKHAPRASGRGSRLHRPECPASLPRGSKMREAFGCTCGGSWPGGKPGGAP